MIRKLMKNKHIQEHFFKFIELTLIIKISL